MENELIDERSLSRLKWRCRRGLLENDIFIARFFRNHEATLTVAQSESLLTLMDLSDNDLMDLLLGRKPLAEVEPELDRDDIRELLNLLREKPLKGQL